jgi:hypothetical protein
MIWHVVKLFMMYTSPFTIKYEYLGTITSSFLVITHAYEMLDGEWTVSEHAKMWCHHCFRTYPQ